MSIYETVTPFLKESFGSKEKLKDIDNVLNSIEKLKRQEDTELDSWHKDIESLKQKLMTVENRLFHL